MKTLTSLESEVLRKLFDSAARNGHAYGWTDVVPGVSKRQLGAVINSLISKGLIHVPAEEEGRFYWTDMALDLIKAGVTPWEL